MHVSILRLAYFLRKIFYYPGILLVPIVISGGSAGRVIRYSTDKKFLRLVVPVDLSLC